jgi:hypothetical protein
VEKDILHAVERSPGNSIKRLAHRHIFQRTVVRMFYDQLLYLFHMQHVQALQPSPDYGRRKASCEWLL